MEDVMEDNYRFATHLSARALQTLEQVKGILQYLYEYYKHTSHEQLEAVMATQAKYGSSLSERTRVFGSIVRRSILNV